MKRITCIVIDDEPLAIKLIESYVKRIDFVELLGSYSDPVQALSAIKDSKPDFIFLDIQMPDIDGMELARLVPHKTKIVFTTAFKEYAFESYDVAAIDFLLKPIRYDKILRACEKVKERLYGSHTEDSDVSVVRGSKEIYVRAEGEIKRLETDKILYVEGMKDYVRFFLVGARPLTTHMTLKSAESLLPSNTFMRVSRSHIVALPHIRAIDRNLCLYIGDAVIRVTDIYREVFERYLKDRMLS